jgi:hypothetical protein
VLSKNLKIITYKTVILPVVVYGCETVLRRIFGPKRDEVMGDWRKLHNEELHNLHCFPSIVRMTKLRNMRLAEHVARMGTKGNACRTLMGLQKERDH